MKKVDHQRIVSQLIRKHKDELSNTETFYKARIVELEKIVEQYAKTINQQEGLLIQVGYYN